MMELSSKQYDVSSILAAPSSSPTFFTIFKHSFPRPISSAEERLSYKQSVKGSNPLLALSILDLGFRIADLLCERTALG
jgi:hypothetical protein